MSRARRGMIPSALHSSAASSSVTTCRLAISWLASRGTSIGPALAVQVLQISRQRQERRQSKAHGGCAACANSNGGGADWLQLQKAVMEKLQHWESQSQAWEPTAAVNSV